MEADQRNARIFGVLFIITFITSIPALWLYQPVLDDPAGFIAGTGGDNKIFLGVTLELILIVANVATAVVLGSMGYKVEPVIGDYQTASNVLTKLYEQDRKSVV